MNNGAWWRDPWRSAPPALAFGLAMAIALGGLNGPLFHAVNGLAADASPRLWAGITIFGDTLVMLSLCLPLVLRNPRAVAAILLGGIVTTLLVHGLKHPLDLPRPAAVLAAADIHVIGHRLTRTSFPSGHSATIALFVGVLLLQWRETSRHYAAVPLLALGLLVGMSRIVVGAHWPTDVAAGLGLGWLGAIAGVAWARRWPLADTPRGRRAMQVLLAACAAALLLLPHTGYPEVLVLTRVLGLLALLAAAFMPWQATAR